MLVNGCDGDDEEDIDNDRKAVTSNEFKFECFSDTAFDSWWSARLV